MMVLHKEGGASVVISSYPPLTSLKLEVADFEELEPKKLRISIFITGTKTNNLEIL